MFVALRIGLSHFRQARLRSDSDDTLLADNVGVPLVVA
jgi:hypothetical protein